MTEVNGKYAPRPGKILGAAINLGGVDLVLAPLNLRLMREFEAQAKKLSEQKDPAPTPEDYYELNLGAVLASLNRNYPKMTHDEVDALLDSHTIQEAVNLVLNQTGLKRVSPGELPPVE